MAKKIIVIIFSVLIFNACSMIDKQYKYYPIIENNKIHIVGYLNNQYDENSPLSVLKIEDKKNGTHVNHKIKLLDSTIKIVKDGKEYIIPYSKLEDYDEIYIYIRILKNGVNITDDEFVVYLGKIELDTGEIIKLPPLHFKKYVYITKGSILNTINPNGKFDQYYNTVEEYKKNGWKEE